MDEWMNIRCGVKGKAERERKRWRRGRKAMLLVQEKREI